MTISVELPDMLAESLGGDPASIRRRLLEQTAIAAYRAGTISHGKVGELLGKSWHETESFLQENAVPLNYGVKEFEEDLDPQRAKFDALVAKWKRETGRMSLVTLRYAHQAYHEILVMGERAVPWILEELKARPDRWFSALQTITKATVTQPGDTFDSAVAAWLKWGREHGYNV